MTKPAWAKEAEVARSHDPQDSKRPFSTIVSLSAPRTSSQNIGLSKRLNK